MMEDMVYISDDYSTYIDINGYQNRNEEYEDDEDEFDPLQYEMN